MKMFEPGCGFWYHGFSYCTTEARIFSRRARHFVHFVHFSQIRASAASRSEQQSSMGPAVVGCHRQFPARTLLCGGADVLACTIRFSPEIAPRWRARRRVGLPGPHQHRHQDGARPGARWQRRNTASLQRPCRRGTFSWAATTAATRKR